MIQPGFAAIGSGNSYGSSFGNNSPGNGGGMDGNGMDSNGMGNGQNGMGGMHDNGQQGGQAGMQGLQQPEYTLAGILHFLQSEWRRYERDRNEWEIERAEMRARVALLEGERRSIENLKTDLMRRVKMLEFALRQERSKYLAAGQTNAVGGGQSIGSTLTAAINPKHAALQNLDKASTSSGRSSPAPEAIAPSGHEPRGQSTISSINTNNFNTLNTSTFNGATIAGPGPGHTRPRKSMPENVPSSFAPNEGQNNAAATARRQRSLDKNSYPGVKNTSRGVQPFGETLEEREEEGLSGETGEPFLENKPNEDVASAGKNAENTESAAASRTSAETDPSTQAHSIEEGSQNFNGDVPRDIADEDEREPVTAIYRPSDGSSGEGQNDWAKLKEVGRIEREKRDRERLGGMKGTIKAGTNKADEDELANLTFGHPSDGTEEEASRLAAEAAAESQMWKSKKVLRGHLDSVRAVAFDSSDIGLYSASDDGTIKYWRVDASTLKQNKPNPSGSLGNADIDPVATLRSHSGAVTCLALSNSKRKLYSGSVDASIVVWKLLDSNTVEPYPPFDKTSEIGRLVGHTQPIWDLAILPTRGDEEGLLASASADGTVKIWNIQDNSTETGNAGGKLLNSFDYFGSEPSAEKEKERESLLSSPAEGKEAGSLPVPTSIAPCMSDLRKCAVSFSNSIVKLFDIESGKEVMQFASDAHYDGTAASQINKVLTHPTLPTLITGHENNYIQFFDINTGACILSMVAHLDSVTSLDIDPSGLTLVSGGHDCSVRFWDLANEGNTAVCVQEITAHRKKSAEGVLMVRYHPNAPYFSSAGADGVIRIYG
ncbi:hypothetical protein L7F22_068200 [Adiantum nelumboides]|nr:hypothetical protein [Adiantum nelumboides]